jgi:hypothetical protein
MISRLLVPVGFCIMLLALSGLAEADPPIVQSIDIDPDLPDVWDDILCHAEFWDADTDLSSVRFRWYRNTVLIRETVKAKSGSWDQESDLLSSSFTEEGDQIICKVTVTDSTGNTDSDDSYVNIERSSANNPPVIQDIPDQTTEIGERVLVDLWQYSGDIEDSDSPLDFQIDNQGNTDIIDCILTDDRYVWCSEAKQLGENRLTVRVTDSQGAWDTDSFEIRVMGGCISCDNDPPEIETIDIDPSSPGETDDLNCEVHVEDPDGNLDNVEFRWFVEGMNVRNRIRDVSGFSDQASDTLDSTEIEEGDSVECFATVEDDDGAEDEAFTGVEIRETGLDCNIDLFGLVVEDEEDIVFRIKNRGDSDEIVEYRIFVDDDLVDADDVFIDEDETRTIRFRFDDFERGESYDIGAWARVDCGDTDEDEVRFTILDGGDDCEIRIEDLDVDGDDIEFRIRNLGDDDENVEYEIFVDDDRVERDDVRVDEGDSERISFDYDEFEEDEEFEIRVRAEADCGDVDIDEDDFIIGDVDDDDCKISISGLEVENDEDIIFWIRNSGNRDVDVEYRIFVDGDKVEEEDIEIDEDDRDRISFEYDDFDDGETYKIRIRAVAECGDTDEETKTIVIGTDCDRDYLNFYRCSGDWLQRRYRTEDCDLVWKNWEYCSQGCSGTHCIGTPGTAPSTGCGLSIDRFEHSPSLSPGATGFMRVVVSNTGRFDEDFRVDFFLDGSRLGSKEFELSPGISTTKVWNFNVGSGSHTVRVDVESDCGASESRQATIGADTGLPIICNYNQVCETFAGESFSNCPFDCPEPGPPPDPTSVDIKPGSLDIVQFKSKVISIDITAGREQDFGISVAGVPPDWLKFGKIVHVEDRKTVHVFVNPKQLGKQELAVTVQALSEGSRFTEVVDLYVAPPGDESEQADDGITGTLIGFATNIYTIIFMIILVAIVLAYFGYRQLKTEDEVTFDKR